MSETTLMPECLRAAKDIQNVPEYHRSLLTYLLNQVDFLSKQLAAIHAEGDAGICRRCKSSRRLLGVSEPLYKALEDIKAGEEVIVTIRGIRVERTFRAEMKAKFEARYPK